MTPQHHHQPRRARVFAASLLLLAACATEKPTPAPAGPTAAPSTSPAQAPATETGKAPSPARAPSDTIETSAGPLAITAITHGSVLFQWGGKNIYVDPWSKGDFRDLPKADLILITDIHQDHLDPAAIDLIKQTSTVIWGPQAVADKLPGTQVIKNGDTKEWQGVSVEAVPMYNLTRGPEAGKLFHDKGRGNGYVLGLGGKRVYLSGDTECIPEMKALKNIDAAFVCMNLPYTMPPSEAAACVKEFKPKVLYPYHYRDSKLEELEAALSGVPGLTIKKLPFYF